MQQLDGAYEQVRGAREHLDDLKPEIEAFRGAVRDSVALDRQPGTVVHKGRTKPAVIGRLTAPVNLPAPPRTSRLIGETVQNLRAALDYLIYELCCFDAKSIIDGTQFVIADSEEDFVSKCKRRFRGMSGEHIAMFQQLQPYAGCNWTGIIRDLSNPDKHRHLTAVHHPVGLTIQPGSTDAILAGKSVDMNAGLSIEITFSDGAPVIEQLEQLVSEVTKILRLFEGQFQ